MSRSERMSSIDTSWLRMDRPTNLMMITGVMMLEGPVDLDAVERRLEEGLLVFPRFRQRVATYPTGLFWVDDKSFDISRHIKRIRLPGLGGKAELQRYVAELAATPLNMSHPLWQFTLVEDYEGGAALVSRIHHAIGDGMALIAVLMSMTDASPDGAATIESPDDVEDEDESGPYGLFAPVRRIIDLGVDLSRRAVQEGMGLAAKPARAFDLLRGGIGVAAELAYLLVMPSDSQTRFKGQPGGDKRVAWTDAIPLPEVKAVSQALGCSVNDMLLTAVAGALRSYLEDRGDETEGVEVRALVPINLREKGSEFELGNYFGIIAIELPVGIENPLERLYELRRRMDALKQSYEPPVTLGLFAALGYAPKLVQDSLFDMLVARATAVMTNVPGPQYPLYIGGSRINQIMFWVPQSGSIGMGVSILSFDGKVQFGLITDSAMVPDPEAIIAGFQPEFEKLLYFALMEAWAETDVELHKNQRRTFPDMDEPESPPAPRPKRTTRNRAAPAEDASRPKTPRVRPAAKRLNAKPAAKAPAKSGAAAKPRAARPRSKAATPESA